MSTEKFKNKYRIPSARAVWHDYNGGAYFITICTKNKEHYFGEIENAIMHLSEIGEFAQQNLQNIHTHNPYAEIPLFVIMPNHIHIIVFINPDFSNNPPRPRRDVARNVSQGFERSKKLVRAAKSFDALHETSRDVSACDVSNRFKRSVETFVVAIESFDASHETSETLHATSLHRFQTKKYKLPKNCSHLVHISHSQKIPKSPTRQGGMPPCQSPIVKKMTKNTKKCAIYYRVFVSLLVFTLKSNF
ncbi:MAG: hypothetical protein FWC39_11160 [Bacteroidetes bacterium]|nr:hypothetical protein [Bacteroidota bacterium]